MDNFWATITGAIIGSITSIGTTWVSELIHERRAGKLDKVRTDTLKRLLSSPKFEWRSIEVLSDAIGAERDTTVRLLLLAGARRSMKSGRDLWGMVPWPDDFQ
jgi:hypothetical protein